MTLRVLGLLTLALPVSQSDRLPAYAEQTKVALLLESQRSVTPSP
jgi:hypothetical protein